MPETAPSEKSTVKIFAEKGEAYLTFCAGLPCQYLQDHEEQSQAHGELRKEIVIVIVKAK
jgi:hypothetical protein